MNPIAQQLELQAAAVRMAGLAVASQMKIMQIVTQSVFQMPTAQVNRMHEAAKSPKKQLAMRTPAKVSSAKKVKPVAKTKPAAKAKPTASAKAAPVAKPAVKATPKPDVANTTTVAKPAPRKARALLAKKKARRAPSASAAVAGQGVPLQAERKSVPVSPAATPKPEAKPTVEQARTPTAKVEKPAPVAASKTTEAPIPPARRTRAPSNPPGMPTSSVKMDD